ncbi:MAG: TIGR03758 family integrating conjugative element protein [Gammaproteobacteria bacterium]|nr:TIGR03758 family integrating conjugative element protein [Gammaproteobacteria bacterium]MCY4358848.1 TIGR03758 family integrating conjugative element protein [Gammaproteobacteria bacterium]
MTADQQAAFAAGSGVTSSVLLTANASALLLLTMVWVTWIVLGSFRAWQEGQASLFDLIWSSLRASMVLMVLGFYIR